MERDAEDLREQQARGVGHWSATGSIMMIMKVKSEFTQHPKQGDSYKMTGRIKAFIACCLVDDTSFEGEAEASGMGSKLTDSKGYTTTGVLSSFDAKSKRATYTFRGMSKDGPISGTQVEDGRDMSSTSTTNLPTGGTLVLRYTKDA